MSNWGGANRPFTSLGLSFPDNKSGTDGDIQVKQTNLGAKIFGKIGGSWYGAALTATEGDPVTRIGISMSDHLSIDKDSVDIYKDNIKVAQLGSTITLGSTSHARTVISNAGIDMYSGQISGTSYKRVAIDNTGLMALGGPVNADVAVGSAVDCIRLGGASAEVLVMHSATEFIRLDENGLRVFDGDATHAVAEFGATTLIGDDRTEHVKITGSSLEIKDGATIMMSLSDGDINMKGKINITSVATQNVVIGVNGNDAGSDNVALGVNAGASLETGGNKNICIGTDAGEGVTTADNNICIGTDTGKALTVTSYNTLIGVNAGTILAGTGTQAIANTVVGSGAGLVVTTGSGNTYIGASTIASGTGVVNEVVLAGFSSGATTPGKGNHTLLLGNDDTTYILPFTDSQQELGSDALEFQDIWAASGSVNSSDERLKENIQDLSISGLEKINALRPRTFDWRKRTEVIDEVTKITHKGNGKIGFIAQEVQDIIPEAVVNGRGVDDFLDKDGNILIPKGTKSLGLGMSSSTIMAYMVKAVQELSAKIDTMQTEINTLKAE